jgi:O-antigen/teichoic acid export membrane protein
MKPLSTHSTKSTAVSGSPSGGDSQGPKRPGIVTNSVANFAGFAGAALLTFFVAPLLVHGLGDARYGIWALVESIIGYLGLFDLGVGAALVRYGAQHHAKNERLALNRLFSTSIAFYAIVGALVFVTSTVLALVWERPFGVAPDLAHDMRWLLVIAGFNLGAGFPLSAYTSILSGLERYTTRVVIQLGGGLVSFVLFMVILGQGGGLISVVIATTAVSLCQYLATLFAVRRLVPELTFQFRFINRDTFRAIRGYGLFFFIALLGYRVSFRTSAIIIGAFLPAQFITFYVIAVRLVDYARDASSSLTTGFMPAVSAWQAQGRQSEIRDLWLDGTRWVLYLALPLFIGLLMLGWMFLALWLGAKYANQSYGTLAILAICLVCSAFLHPSDRVLQGTGSVRALALFSVVQASFNLGLSLVLVIPMGIEGVAWGTVIPLACHTMISATYVGYLTGVRPLAYLHRAVSRPVVAAILLALAWYCALRLLPSVNWRAFIAIGFLGIVPYSCLVTLLEPRLRQALLTLLARPVTRDHFAAVVETPANQVDVSESNGALTPCSTNGTRRVPMAQRQS